MKSEIIFLCLVFYCKELTSETLQESQESSNTENAEVSKLSPDKNSVPGFNKVTCDKKTHDNQCPYHPNDEEAQKAAIAAGGMRCIDSRYEETEEEKEMQKEAINRIFGFETMPEAKLISSTFKMDEVKFLSELKNKGVVKNDEHERKLIQILQRIEEFIKWKDIAEKFDQIDTIP